MKLLTYNIHKGLNWSNRYPILPHLRQFLKENEADVVCLQEICGHSSYLKKKFGHIISEKEWSVQFEYLADTTWTHFAYGKNAIYGETHHGNAILSKYPILSWMKEDISTNRFEQRGLLYAKIEWMGKPLHLYCVHLNLLASGRMLQYQKIKEALKQHPPHEAIIVAGDFNDWNQQAKVVLEQDMGFKDAYYEKFGAYARTFPAFFPVLTLDRIYVKNIFIKDAQVLKRSNLMKDSDHLAMIVELIWDN